jgi:hypothetical protein
MKPILERIPQHQSESFYCEVVSARTLPTPWHFHPECQLTLAVNSVGNRMVGDNLSDFSSGDLVFVGPNLPHVWNHAGPQNTTKDTPYSIVVQFRETCFGAEFMALPELARVRRLIKSGAVALRVTGATRAYAAERMLEIPQTSSPVPGRSSPFPVRASSRISTSWTRSGWASCAPSSTSICTPLFSAMTSLDF